MNKNPMEKVFEIVEEQELSGDVYQPRSDIIARTQAAYPYLTEEAIQNALDGLCGQGHLTHEGDIYSITETAYNENLLAQYIAGYIAHNVPTDRFDAETSLRQAETRLGVCLSQSQRAAVIGALGCRLCVITGGPGSGKTTTLKALCAAFPATNPSDIMLMAPTGKAARRLAEQTERDASTVHSVLYCGRYTRRYEDGELAPRLIVVDEASMLSINLLADLMRSISPMSRVILVGDPAQLPAVGAGQVLSDLLVCGLPIFRLTDNFRQFPGSYLAEDIDLIRAGHTELKFDGSSVQLMETVSSHDTEVLSLSLYLSLRSQGHAAQILTPVGKCGVCSAKQMNTLVQDFANPPSGEKLEVTIGKTIFRLGDSVIQLVNNEFGRNGDVGTIVSIIGEEELRLGIQFDFGDTPVYYTVNDIAKNELLDLAYALTIHKSQGSEYDYVIVPLAPEHVFMWSNNMIYTAASRAKKKLILVGDRNILAQAIRTPQPARNTRLLEKINWNLPPAA